MSNGDSIKVFTSLYRAQQHCCNLGIILGNLCFIRYKWRRVSMPNNSPNIHWLPMFTSAEKWDESQPYILKCGEVKNNGMFIAKWCHSRFILRVKDISKLFASVQYGVQRKCTEPAVLVCLHYSDVVIGAIASQITSLTVVYSGTYQRKHQSSASLAFVRGIHRWPVNSSHKGSVTRKIYPFDDTMCYGYVPTDFTADLWVYSRGTGASMRLTRCQDNTLRGRG